MRHRRKASTGSASSGLLWMRFFRFELFGYPHIRKAKGIFDLQDAVAITFEFFLKVSRSLNFPSAFR